MEKNETQSAQKLFYWQRAGRQVKAGDCPRHSWEVFFIRGNRSFFTKNKIQIEPNFWKFISNIQRTKNNFFKIWAPCRSEISHFLSNIRFSNTCKANTYIPRTLLKMSLKFCQSFTSEWTKTCGECPVLDNCFWDNIFMKLRKYGFWGCWD